MKLDNIVYDYSTLQNALATALNNESPTFQAIYPSDTATSLVNVMAAYGSMLEYQIVSAMANAYTDSAYSPTGIRQLAETLGNRLHGNISSEIYCTIERTNLKGISNVVIPAGSKFTIGDLNFFNPNSIVFPLTSNILHDIKLVQGLWQTAEYTTAGVSGEKIYFCDDFKCNTNMVRVFVNDVEWAITDTFLPYVVTDTEETTTTNVVILRTESDGRTFIKFGNNTNGVIPSAGTKVRIEYVYNEGANGNLGNTAVEVKLITPIYYVDTVETLGKRIQLEVNITPTSTAAGGFDTQSLDVLKESSPYVFGSGQRAIRRNDYKSMLLNQCGYLTCNVWGEYEEAAIQGGYDKIMMNMVYYTGIKSIQKYDLQPVTTLNLNLSEIQDTAIKFYTLDNNIISARGFLGSYVVDISSYDADNNPITVKYRDASGTGILTCDPSINSKLNNFEEQVFPINDLLSNYEKDPEYVNIHTNQVDWPLDTPQVSTIKENDPYLLVTGPTEEDDHRISYQSSGTNEYGQPVLISFDNPFQIKFDFPYEEKSITAFAFKTPNTDIRNFIHQFAIYGTSEELLSTDYENIKNNEKWDKLTGMQSFDNSLGLDKFSDWISTKVYSPGTSETLSETFNAAKQIDDKTLKITELTGDNYTYKVKIDGITQPNTSYYIDTITNTLTFTTPIQDLSKIVLYGTLRDWKKYQHYVIEIYSIQDNSSTTSAGGQFVAIAQIKALFKESSSTINYNNNNNIRINLPVISKENVVDTYTIPRKLPYDLEWLSTENKQDQSILAPIENMIYFVNDQNTYENTIEIVSGGSGYVPGEVLTILNYKLSFTIEESGEKYKLNEIIPFAIGSITAQLKVTEIDDVGGLISLDFLNGTEFTGFSLSEPTYGTNPGYYGSGIGAKVKFITSDITSSTTNNLQIRVVSVIDTDTDHNKIDKYQIIDGEGNIIEASEKAITHYRAIGNNITTIGSVGNNDATFKVTGKVSSPYNKSTVSYNNNLNKYINDTQNIKGFGLPAEMQYYNYTCTINGLTGSNGYNSEDVLTYTISADNYVYTFSVKVLNIGNQDFNITLEIDDHYPTNILKGKSNLNIQEASFTDDAIGKATLSISSESTVNVYGNYTGNYYTNTDIQALDLPIIDKYNHFTTYLEFKQPHIKNVNIELNVEYENVSTYQDTKAAITKAIYSLFDIKPYSIGSTLNVSDIWKAVNSIPGIKRFNVITPVDNIDSMPYELIVLPAENLIINDIISSNGYK